MKRSSFSFFLRPFTEARVLRTYALLFHKREEDISLRSVGNRRVDKKKRKEEKTLMKPIDTPDEEEGSPR